MGLSNPGPTSGNGLTSVSNSSRPQTWVRRRRWVRIMRRRLDIPPLPFLEPDGSMYHLDAYGTLLPYTEETNSPRTDEDGQELGAMPPTFLSSAKDYVARARYLVGTQSQSDMHGTPSTAIEARRAIAKLERATTELRQGILGQYVCHLWSFKCITKEKS